MIAHSLPDPFFGPASKMHGATYVINATFKRASLTDQNVVLDIGEAMQLTKEVCSELNYQNLDQLPQFKNILTTTEFLAKYIHDQIMSKLMDEELSLKIELLESHIAAASYEG